MKQSNHEGHNHRESETFEAHWVGKEWEAFDGNLVLVGILVEAKAAWVAIAIDATKLKNNSLLSVYIYNENYGWWMSG